MMSKEKNLKRNIVMGLLNTLTNMIFPLLIFIYASRMLQPDGLGISQLATSISSYFDLFASLGIPLYAVRQIAKLRDDENTQHKNALEIFYANIINALIMFFAYFVFISIAYQYSKTFWIFFVYGFVILANAIGVEWFFKGNEEFTYITIRNIFVKALCLILIIVFVKKPDDVLLYGIISIGSTLLYCLINFFKFAKITKLRKVKLNYKKHLKPALAVFLMSVATTLYCSVDTVMLGLLKTDYDVGIYSAAFKVTTSIIAVITAINSILLPRLSYYYEINEYEKIKQILNSCYQITLIMAIPIVIACEIFAPNMIFLISGADYLSATPALRIMAPIILFVALTNLIGIQIFYSSGNVKKTVISVFCGAGINILLNSILIPLLSYEGAAIGTLFAEFGVLIVQLLIGKKLLIFEKININILKIILCSLITSGIIFGLSFIINIGYIPTLIIMAIIAIIIHYLVLLISKENNIVFITKFLINRILRRN